jgi:hypothetical protein
LGKPECSYLCVEKSIKIMKSIKFTDDELDFIRQQYQVELEEAQKYVESLKNIIKKIDSPKSVETIEIPEKKRRGRKPKVQKEESLIPELVKKGRKQRKDKGKKRRRPDKPVKVEKPVKETTPILIPGENGPTDHFMPI